MFRVMDLFSGIGGFSLGLKRTGGFQTVAYCEIEPYCQAVLLARMRDGWLDTAPIHPDITRLDGGAWRGRVDVITGGFPCQDIAWARNKAGIEGSRSGLWREMARLVGEVRPRFVVVENVSALLRRGLYRVLGDLAEIGYDAEWDCIPASAVGAPHKRDRVWIVAYPESDGLQGRVFQAKTQGLLPEVPTSRHWAGGVFSDWPKLLAEPKVRNLADGFPYRVAELTALGNSIIPQIAGWIGGRILDALATTSGCPPLPR